MEPSSYMLRPAALTDSKLESSIPIAYTNGTSLVSLQNFTAALLRGPRVSIPNPDESPNTATVGIPTDNLMLLLCAFAMSPDNQIANGPITNALRTALSETSSRVPSSSKTQIPNGASLTWLTRSDMDLLSKFRDSSSTVRVNEYAMVIRLLTCTISCADGATPPNAGLATDNSTLTDSGTMLQTALNHSGSTIGLYPANTPVTIKANPSISSPLDNERGFGMSQVNESIRQLTDMFSTWMITDAVSGIIARMNVVYGPTSADHITDEDKTYLRLDRTFSEQDWVITVPNTMEVVSIFNVREKLFNVQQIHRTYHTLERKTYTGAQVLKLSDVLSKLWKNAKRFYLTNEDLCKGVLSAVGLPLLNKLIAKYSKSQNFGAELIDQGPAVINSDDYRAVVPYVLCNVVPVLINQGGSELTAPLNNSVRTRKLEEIDNVFRMTIHDQVPLTSVAKRIFNFDATRT